ncbi:SET domain-containing protein SmydA-8-like [Chironomus tepperi]|uniref:SET domain-containing protein SmydA-8-like n=1 Tax=Chironomus tepperi TaxID=113505 RepID=UPI00391F2122
MENCAVCGVESKQKCSGCNLVFYCSRDHQVADWKKGHKTNCKCYDILCNDILGRYMVAKRDIKPGEIILREKPIVIGPKTISNVLCLGCHQSLYGNYYNCSKCTWPLCGKSCETSEYHVEECKIMSEKNFKTSIKATGKLESSYCVIVPLRVIMMRKTQPKMYEKLSKLVSHLDQRISTKLYDVLRANLVPFILSFLRIPDITEKEILEIAGILDTNCFEVFLSSKKVKARGIFFETAMMAHECISNTKHFVDENLEMRVFSTQQIKKGEMILTSYSHPLKTTIERRMAIKIAKCFDCVCPRCTDPTEKNTFSSSIKCSTCEDGVLTSCDPLTNLSEWKCIKCEHKVAGAKVIQLMSEIRNSLDRLNKRSVVDCENFMKSYKKFLPDSSVFMVDVKYALCMLYGNVEGYFYEDLSLDQIQRKLQICNQLLSELTILEPGISNSVLNTKFELNVAEILIIKRQFKPKDETSKLIASHMAKITEIYNLLRVASDGKALIDNRFKKIKEESLL